MKIRTFVLLLGVSIFLTGCVFNNDEKTCQIDSLEPIRLGGTWVSRTSGTKATLLDVVWTGSRFVAVGTPDTILTSKDGTLWQPIPVSGTFNSLAVSPSNCTSSKSSSLVVAVGAAGKILTSPDGLTWTPAASPSTQTLNAIEWIKDRFVIVGTGGVILTSTDGVTWASQFSGTTKTLWDVAGNDSILVAVGDTLLSSSDGVSWTARGVGGNTVNGLTWVSWSGTGFTTKNPGTVPLSSGYAFYSSDGISWTMSAYEGTKPQIFGNQTVTLSGGSDVSTEAAIYVSPVESGDSAYQALGSEFLPRAVAWSGKRLVVIGSRGEIHTLP